MVKSTDPGARLPGLPRSLGKLPDLPVFPFPNEMGRVTHLLERAVMKIK